MVMSNCTKYAYKEQMYRGYGLNDHPVDDAKGNAEAMLAMAEKHGMLW